MISLLGLVNGLLALGTLVWPLAVFSTIFFFDAPGSSSNWITVALAISIATYPIPAVLGNVLFWANRKTSKPAALLLYTALSALGYIAIAAFVVLLDLVCAGKFACN